VKYALLLRVKRLCFACVTLAAVVAGLCDAQIRRVQDFREGGSLADWSSQGAIVFKRGRELWLARPDKRGDLCLTCGNSGLAAHHNTSPAWLPGSGWFLFRSGEGRVFRGDTSRHVAEVPGIHSKAADFRFSRDGKVLAWTQRSEPRAAFLATVAGISITGAHPLVLPGDLVFETVDDFLPDGRGLLVTASRRGGDPRFTEIYACNVSGSVKCRAVTDKPGERDDYARLTPSGRQLLFASSDVGWGKDDPVGYLADYWLLDLEPPGGMKRMTWFNEPANPNYIDNGVRAENACWGPDGKWLLATLILDAKLHRTRLVKIEFP
jgi:hypothetical protein